MRTMLVWRRATRLPRIIDAAARIQMTGCHMSAFGKNPKITTDSSATNPPAFDATERKAVTGVGAPSYVSGAQKWNGTALTLNANPTMVRKPATRSSGSSIVRTRAAMSVSSVEPVRPNTSDMP